MSIAITDDHRSLADTVSSFAEKRDLRGAARAKLESPDDALPDFWGEFAELGWLGLHLPEDVGGSGYGVEELVVVVEELARAVAPGPFVPTVIAGAVIAAAGDDDLRARLLPGFADGSTVAAVALGGAVTVSGSTASGDAGVALGAGSASLLLVPAGDDVAIVEVGDGVTVDTPPSLDPTRRSARVTLDGAAATVISRGSSDARRSRPCRPGCRRRRRGTRVHRHGCGVLEGAHPVRSPDRHVPGGQASLRQHGGGNRTGDERGVGCGACRSDRRRSAQLCGRISSHAGRTGGRSVRQSEHAGARWHRHHVGARCPSVHAPGDHPAALSRRGRSGRTAHRSHPSGRRA